MTGKRVEKRKAHHELKIDKREMEMKKISIRIQSYLLICLVGLSLDFSAFAIPAEGTKIMVSGPSPYAVQIAQIVAEQGGNVVDVAVAMGLALSVTSPYYAALGGGGFALVKMDGPVEALDFRETAPKATSPQFYLDKESAASVTGGAAVGVPGFPAGLWALHKKYGKLKWKQLFVQPLLLAEKGFRVSGEWYAKTEATQTRFRSGGHIPFLKKGQQLYLPGEVLKQKGLAKALRLFRDKNIKGFYEGQVAQDIVNTVQQSGGVLSLEDLKNYSVRSLKPLETQFKDYRFYLMPPPSSGGVVIKTAFQLIEQVELDKKKPFSVEELHLLSEIL
ncbi:MAG: gamma-glutamyltransferase, partial [Bdellovibrionales bacterium]|nr:gamma-glutamyltransferase [Bdellovibrionales bacterium]